MAAQLAATVYVEDPETRQTVTLHPGTLPEPRLAALVTSKGAWVDGKLPRLAKATAQSPQQTSGQGGDPTGDGPDDASGDASASAGNPPDEGTGQAATAAKKTAAAKTAARKPARGRDAASQGDGGA